MPFFYSRRVLLNIERKDLVETGETGDEMKISEKHVEDGIFMRL